MFRSKYFPLFVGLTVLVGWGAWLWWSSSANIATQAANSGHQVTPATRPSGTAQNEVPGGGKSRIAGLPTVVNKTRGSTSPLYEKYKHATDLGVLYAEFEALAKTDPEAQYFQADILKVCTMFVGVNIQRLEEKVENNPTGPMRKAAVAALKTKCKEVPAEASKVSSSELMREAATRGDSKSKAFLFRFGGIGIGEKSMEDTSGVRALALSQDPIVLNNLDGYFDARNKKLVWNIPGIEGQVSGEEMAHAFRLVACDLGYDCSATSIDSQVACAYRGYCDGDRVTQIQNNLVSASGFNRLQQIRDTIFLGFSTGRWPDGFWSGSNGSIRK